MLTLYYSEGACSLASHIMLIEYKLAFNLKKVNLGAHEVDGKDFTAINPKGYVPFLVLDSGEDLCENVAVLSYITDLSANIQATFSQNNMARYRLLEWLAFINSELHKGFGAFFDKRVKDDYRELARERLRKRFAYVNEFLTKNTFLWNNEFSAADAYLFTVLRWLKFVNTGININYMPNLVKYIDRLAELPAVKQALTTEHLKI